MSAALGPNSSLRLQILGPLRLWRAGTELDVGPRQQAYLLALLLAREGRPVSTTDLIRLMWDEEAPASALNVVQKYVGGLRRLLDPAVPPRGAGTYLRRQGNAYLFVAGPAHLDLVVFRNQVAQGQESVAQHRPGEALDHYLEALNLWRGRAGDGLDHTTAAVSVFAALDAEFFDACSAATELAVTLGQPARVLPALRLATSMAPLHEPLHSNLVHALAASGQQAEALSVFAGMRARLVEELGIEPGPALRAAHQQVLTQPPPPPVAPPGETDPTASSSGQLVGRTSERTVLRRALGAVLTGGTGLVLVEGEPGVGKTRLLEETATEAEQLGACVVWGHCPPGEGTPALWPWVETIGAVLAGLPEGVREKWLAGELGRLVEPRDDVLGEPSGGILTTPVRPDTGAQFRLFERVTAVLTQAATERPLLLIVDDLQWADLTSLHLLAHLVDRRPRSVMIVGALRNRAPALSPELTRLLAAAGRSPDHRRIRLGPLRPAEVADLVRGETGRLPGPVATRRIHERTAGNPFFVRELARLLADSGGIREDGATPTGVPATVRDVVRDRMSVLDTGAGDLLQIAALIGRNVDLSLLARVAGLDVQTCLGRLEPVEALGLLGPTPGNPFSFHFTHDLVRESVIETTPTGRASHLHLRVADALEEAAPGGESAAEHLAHHLWSAGPLAEPARTVGALVRAGRRAAAKSALESAGQHLRSAAQVARSAGLAQLELSALSQLTAVVGMRSGYVGSALDVLDRAEHLARGLGREREATDFLYSRCATYSQSLQLERAGQLAGQLLAHGEASPDPIVRAYGLHAWGIHQWDIGNIGAAFAYLSQLNQAALGDLAKPDENRLRHDLQLLSPVILAQVTALHGDVGTARVMLDAVAGTAGDDPHAVTLSASFTSTTAALAGDPDWALRTAERGIAADPAFSLVFYGAYLRMNRCWARAVTGQDPASAAAEAEELIGAVLLDPPLTGVSTRYGLLAEMWLAAGELDKAAEALDQAQHFLTTYRQRYAEGLVLLLRARLLQARGEPVGVVRAAAERARTLAVEREAYLFAHRAQALLSGLGP